MTLADASQHGASHGRLQREVREAMTPGVVSIPGDASLGQAFGALAAHNKHAVLVVERRSGTPLGWINAAGLLQWAMRGAGQHTAAQAVCEPVHTISPSSTVADAVELLLKPGVTHVLVAHDNSTHGEGVLTDLDVVRLISGR